MSTFLIGAGLVELVCSRLEARGGKLTGRYLGPQCVNAEKVRMVERLLNPREYAHVYAYGDTKEDLALLQLAGTKVYRGEVL